MPITVLTPKTKIPGELRRHLPRSWIEAAGILKGKKGIDALRYQRQLRKEWERRFKKLTALR